MSIARTNGVKFISFEPLLEYIGGIGLHLNDIDWIIIGAQSGPGGKIPKIDWVHKIINEADEHNIPVFLKNNLGKLLDEFGRRQEFPISW